MEQGKLEVPPRMRAAMEGQYNSSQMEAVTSGLDGSQVMLVQGPPGTGKTKTILGLVGREESVQRPWGGVLLAVGRLAGASGWRLMAASALGRPFCAAPQAAVAFAAAAAAESCLTVPHPSRLLFTMPLLPLLPPLLPPALHRRAALDRDALGPQGRLCSAHRAPRRCRWRRRHGPRRGAAQAAWAAHL